MGRSGFKGDGVKVQPPYSQVHDQLAKGFTRPDKGTARVNSQKSTALFWGSHCLTGHACFGDHSSIVLLFLGPTC